MQCQRFWSGQAYPLATWDGTGTNFALYSENATKVELCLFDSAERDEGVEPHGPARKHRPGLARLPAGRVCPANSTAIAFMVPTSRSKGTASIRNKSCSDPYAKAIARETKWADELFAYRVGDPEATFVRRSRQRRLRTAGRCRGYGVHLGQRPAAPDTPWDKTLIYELHVKGFTMLQPDVPENLRGTYAGSGLRAVGRLSEEPGRYGRRTDARSLARRRPAPGRSRADELLGLQHPGLLCPRRAYASRPRRASMPCGEFKSMVRTLHAAGIEVILDVVYNHTAEGNQLGPTLSLPRHRQRLLLPSSPTTRATTWTSPAAATR